MQQSVTGSASYWLYTYTMIKTTLLGIFLVLAETSTKTILQDIEDYGEEYQKYLERFWSEKLYKETSNKDPCDPYVPQEPDVTDLKTVSEIKCKEYIYLLKNQQEKEVQEANCRSRKLIEVEQKNENNSSGAIEEYYVYHGRMAEYAEFTHMGAVGWRCKDSTKEWVFKCGSSLISDKFLITAAHCTKLSPRSVRDIVNGDPEVVMLGIENILDPIGNEERRPNIVDIVKIIVHPEYKSPKKYNDIALLEVKNAIEFTKYIMPACVWPHKDITLLGERVTLTGWGETESGKPSSHLQAGDVEILDTAKCEDLLKPAHNRNWHGFIDGQMCAGKPGGRVDTCQGDSGGPLTITMNTQNYGLARHMHLVVGITSFGMKCGVLNQPAVYTRVASYIDWIEEHVWSNQSATTSS